MFCCSVVKDLGCSHLRKLIYFSTFLLSCQQLFLTFLSCSRLLSARSKQLSQNITAPWGCQHLLRTFYELFSKYYHGYFSIVSVSFSASGAGCACSRFSAKKLHRSGSFTAPLCSSFMSCSFKRLIIRSSRSF